MLFVRTLRGFPFYFEAWNKMAAELPQTPEGHYTVSDFTEALNAEILRKIAEYVSLEKIQEFKEQFNRIPVFSMPALLDVFNSLEMFANSLATDELRKAEDLTKFIKLMTNRLLTNSLYNKEIQVEYDEKKGKYTGVRKAFRETVEIIKQGSIAYMANKSLEKTNDKLQVFVSDINSMLKKETGLTFAEARKRLGSVLFGFLPFKEMAQENWGYKKDEDGNVVKDEDGKPIKDKETRKKYTKALTVGISLTVFTLLLKIGKGFAEIITKGYGQAHQMPLIEFWYWQGFYRLVLYNLKTVSPGYNGTIYERAKKWPYFWSGLNSMLAWVLDYCEDKWDACEYIGSFYGGSALAYAAFGAPLVDVQNSTQIRYFFRDMFEYWNFTWAAERIENSPKWANRLFSIFWRQVTVGLGALIMAITTGVIVGGAGGYIGSIAGVLISEQSSLMAVGYRYARIRAKAKVLLGIEAQAFKLRGWRYCDGFMEDALDYYADHWKDPWLDCTTGEWS